MKVKLLIVSLLSVFCSFSQFNPSAPWMDSENSSKRKNLTIDEMSESFNQYWSNHDKNKKGSGYKPFKRWEYHWSFKTDAQGHIMTADQMWQAWNEKNQSKLNKSLATQSLPPSNWQPVGPFSHTNTGSWSSGQGRVNIVVQDPLSSNTVYIGTPAGGIWKSTDAGINWLPMSDQLPQIGVSGIAIDHTNSNIIYIATGDKDAADTYSVGVLKSTDGGLTWNTTGLSFSGNNNFAGDIIMHPTNNQILFCATSIGLYKTTNAGASWSVVQSGNFSQGAVRFKPSDPTVVYATTNNKFYKSTNTGIFFTQTSLGLPSNSIRLLLDVTPANSEYVYVLSAKTNNEFQGVYRSINSGTSFVAQNTTTDVFNGSTQAWFDLALAVSDTNADEVYTGCLNIWKSTNGGLGFTQMNEWFSPTQPSYTHADIHYLGFYNGTLFAGTDGGVYASQNGAVNFTDLTETAQISQFYKIAVSNQSASNMVGGLQDNGGYALSDNEWKNYYGADGMDTAIDPNNPNLYYGFIQFGGNLYITSTAGNGITGSVSGPSNGNWVTPLVANSAGEIFSGFNGLFKLVGTSWVQQNSGSMGSGNLELVAVDPSNDDIMYVSNGTTLYKSVDHGVTFSSIYSASAEISSIEVHTYDSNTIYLTTKTSGGQVLKSTNGGSTFSDITSGIPNIGKNVIVHQGQNPDNPLYVGTSLGVYYRDDSMSSFQPFDTNLPNVAVTDLEINLSDNKLIAATYGRGIWQTDIPVQLANDDVKIISIVSPTNTITCGSVSPVVEIENNGLNLINTVQFNYLVNGTPYNYTWSGTLNSQESTSVSLPALTLARGAYTLSVSATITNDAYYDNNTINGVVYSNDAGVVGVVNPFTNATDELLSYNEGSTLSQWVRGIRIGGTMSSGLGNNVYTTNLTGNYPDMTKSYLVSQCYDLTYATNTQISFDMKFDLEENWDIVYVEYSTDFGANWSVLGTKGAGWYNSDRTEFTTGNDCYNCVGAQWTGTNTTNTNYSYPLTALEGQTNVIFRIVFHTDQAVNQLGVNIDNFVINGVLSNDSFTQNSFSVYPNPSTGIFNISSKEFAPENIEVYDLTGKLILSKSNNNFETTIDLTSASQGIYFVKIAANGQNIVKRIVKE